VFDQVNVHEHPALADLGAGDFPDTRLLLERHRMNMEERGSGLQIERVHARILLACVAIKTYRPK
jgi:hypothetical protein